MATVPAAPHAFGGCGLSAAHRHRLFASRRFPLRCLPCAARTVPEKPRLYNINADGIFQIFGFQTDCVHFRSSFLEELFHALQRVAVGHGQHPLGQIGGEGAAAGKHRGAQRASAPDITIILKAGSL